MMTLHLDLTMMTCFTAETDNTDDNEMLLLVAENKPADNYLHRQLL
jgi:hypothetical protein